MNRTLLMVLVASTGAYRVGTGMLRQLTLGNALTETRTYDGKNAPASITVSRTYGYQDFAYFLTTADGPYGAPPQGPCATGMLVSGGELTLSLGTRSQTRN